MLESINSLPIGTTIIRKDVETIISNLSALYNGTVYYNFALTEMESEIIKIDILFETAEKGIVAVHISELSLESDDESLDKIYIALKNYLSSNSKLRKRRELAIPVNVVNLVPLDVDKMSEDEYVSLDGFESYFSKLSDIESIYYKPLNEALDKIVSAKPSKPRNNVKNEGSKGAVIKEIERQIAYMDKWQRKAAYEITDTPQRIRGLAGSGKTIVLALKAAYIHFLEPTKDIAVTFYSRALYQQFNSLIQEFFGQYTKERVVDFDRIHILHAWGTLTEPGIYSTVSENIGSKIYSYKQATADFGYENAFRGVCKTLLTNLELKEKENIPLYDYILIDEAQDLPAEFYQIAYKLFKTNKKRLVYAYDELQTLDKKSAMPSVKKMFGVNENGEPKVVIDESLGSKTDIILPICYRNNMWNLTIAHALGFGIYKSRNPDNLSQYRGIQFFKDLSIWEDIGYKSINGTTLGYDKDVILKRRENATPEYFFNLMNSNEAFRIENPFLSKEEEFKHIAKNIKKNIEQDELDADDILVIFADSSKTFKDYDLLKKYLNMVGVNSIMPGKDVDRDTFTKKNNITCTHIYRAKGNEQPMVYICGSEHFANFPDDIGIRNMLFTAITRSRAWVRMSGTGFQLNNLISEINEVIENDYTLTMHVPTEHEIEKLNIVNADIQSSKSKEMTEIIKNTDSLVEYINSGKLNRETLEYINRLTENQLNEE